MQLGLYFGTTAVVPMDLQTNDYLRPALMVGWCDWIPAQCRKEGGNKILH